MAILWLVVDPIQYKVHIDRIRNMAKLVMDNTDTIIERAKAVQVIQLSLHSLNHEDAIEAGKRLVDTLVDPTRPSNKDFKNIDDLLEQMSKKITSKKILDETKP